MLFKVLGTWPLEEVDDQVQILLPLFHPCSGKPFTMLPVPSLTKILPRFPPVSCGESGAIKENSGIATRDVLSVLPVPVAFPDQHMADYPALIPPSQYRRAIN